MPLAAGFALGFGSFIYENYDEANAALAATSLFIPAASAAGVAFIGRGRGRTDRAYLCAYAGALVLGGLGFIARKSTGSGFEGAYFGWTAGSMVGSMVGYNLREAP